MAPKRGPDIVGLQKAVAQFLAAAGVDRTDPNLRETPKRVAEAWATDFLDGYRRKPQEILAETYPAPRGADGELVVLTDLRFYSFCPHHLLPYEGRAHIAYTPNARVVGFGRLAALLDCFAHRLILQEDLAREVARALSKTLGSSASACVLQAKQSCLRLRSHGQMDAATHTEAYEGTFQTDKQLRRELWARIGAGQ
jgi:GTP cyclohydrolase IA